MRGQDLFEFIRANDGVPMHELVDKLGVGERAIRKRILSANDAAHGCARIRFDRKMGGYTLDIIDAAEFESWLDSQITKGITAPSTPDERVDYLMQDLLSRTDWITLAELSSVLYVSKATLSSDLRQVETKLNRFGLTLGRRPHHGVKVEGPETQRRICLGSIAVRSEVAHKVGIGEFGEKNLQALSACVDEVLERDNFKVNSFAYHNLIVHIAVALTRIKNNCYVPADANQLSQIQMTDEYKVAADIAAAISDSGHIKLPDPEIAYIAIHLASKRLLDGDDEPVNAQGDKDSLVISDEAWTLAYQMIETVWRTSRFDFRYDVELRMNLARHLMPMAVRLRYRMSLENVLLPDIKERFPLAYSMAADACGVLEDHYGVAPSESEIGYIALSFALALERKKGEPANKRVLVVCASGMGTARLLAYQVKEQFKGYIGSIQTCDAREFDSYDLSAIDYVFTTIPLKRKTVIPVVQISVFLDEGDQREIRSALAGETSTVQQYFNRALFYPHLAFDTREAVIDFLCDGVERVENVDAAFRRRVFKREEYGNTSFGNFCALPHPNEPVSDKTFVAVGLLDSPIDWKGKPVRAVFLISTAEDAEDDLESFYRSMVKLLTQQDAMKRLLDAQTFETLMDELKEV